MYCHYILTNIENQFQLINLFLKIKNALMLVKNYYLIVFQSII